MGAVDLLIAFHDGRKGLLQAPHSKYNVNKGGLRRVQFPAQMAVDCPSLAHACQYTLFITICAKIMYISSMCRNEYPCEKDLIGGLSTGDHTGLSTDTAVYQVDGGSAPCAFEA